MEIDSSWVSIVERYLQAYYLENKLQREARLTSSLAEVFRRFASDLTAESYFAKAKANCETLLATPPSSEWKQITKSEQSVMVEIPVDSQDGNFSKQVPFFPTRLLLTKRGEADWQIDDLLDPCIHCNMMYPHSKSIAGQCSMCNGKGHLQFIEDPTCTYCSGTGKCQNCKDESIAGWRRAAFLCPNE